MDPREARENGGRMRDGEIVARVLSGEPALFEELVHRHQRAAFAVAIASGLPSDAAADVVQDALLESLRSLGSLRDPDGFAAWFLTIVRNGARRQIRRARRIVLGPKATAGAAPPYDECFAKREIDRLVWREVGRLDGEIRETILLYYFHGESVKDVARATGVSISAVKSRLDRGRELLRRRLWNEARDAIRDIVPTTRQWERGARRLTLVALATVPTITPAVASAASAAPAPSASGAAIPSSITGTLFMNGTKTAAFAAAWLLFFTLGFIGGGLPPDGAPGWSARDDVTDGGAAPTATEPDEVALSRETARADGTPADVAPDTVPSPPASSTGALRVAAYWDTNDDPASGVRVGLVRPAGASPDYAPLEAATGEEGEVVFTDLPPGEYRVRLGRGAPVRFVDRVVVGAGRTAEFVVRLREGGAVHGIVVDSGGAPIGSADVWLSHAPFDNVDGSVVATTGSDGRFAVRGASRDHYIGARAAGWAPSSLETVKAERGAPASITLVLPEAGGAIEGRVFGPDGELVAGALVLVGPRASQGFHRGATGPFATRTDADGTFAAPSVRPGRVAVAVRAPELAPLETGLDVVAGRVSTIDVRLELGATLAGRVTRPDGSPVGRATVRIGEDRPFGFTSDPMNTEVRTADDGAFVASGLTPGDATVRVSARDASPHEELVSLVAGEETAIRVVLGGRHRVAGRVTYEDGSAASGVTVLGFGGWERTDGDGRFAFEDCDAGEHDVEVTEGRSRIPVAELRVRAGDESVEIVIEESKRATAWIEGVVVDPDGGRVRGALLRCVPGTPGIEVHADSGFFGGVSAGPVPAGEYRLAVESAEWPRTWIGAVTVAPRERRDVGRLRLARPGTLDLRFPDGSPSPEGATLSVVDEEGRYLLAESLTGERSRLVRVVPGQLRVTIHPRGVRDEGLTLPCVIREGETTILDADLGRIGGQTR